MRVRQKREHFVPLRIDQGPFIFHRLYLAGRAPSYSTKVCNNSSVLSVFQLLLAAQRLRGCRCDDKSLGIWAASGTY